MQNRHKKVSFYKFLEIVRYKVTWYPHINIKGTASKNRWQYNK